MKSYAVEDLHPGMKTAKPVYTNRGQLVIEEGTALTTALISRLFFYGIASIEAEEPKEDTPEERPVFVPRTSYSQQVKRRPEFMEFQIDYTKHLGAVKDSFESICNSNGQIDKIDTDGLLAGAAELLKKASTTLGLLDMLHNMRQIDDSIYAHNMNVALLSRTIGEWLHFSKEDLELVTLCGMLHDIGKTALPPELLNKPGKYTEEEFAIVRQHPLLGYKILKDLPLSVHVKRAALMHHERGDGSGYPQGLKEGEIDSFAQIVAIADVYDAMTAARSYRAPLCPFEVIAAFENEGLQKYHPEYILTFLNRIANSYQHNRVLLSNGQSGTIVMINSKHLTQPMIQMDDGKVIDLTEHHDLSITKII